MTSADDCFTNSDIKNCFLTAVNIAGGVSSKALKAAKLAKAAKAVNAVNKLNRANKAAKAINRVNKVAKAKKYNPLSKSISDKIGIIKEKISPLVRQFLPSEQSPTELF